MAYVQKSGSRYCVKKGNTGETLSCFTNKKDADKEMNRLHRKNMPKASNRGKTAQKRQNKRK